MLPGGGLRRKDGRLSSLLLAGGVRRKEVFLDLTITGDFNGNSSQECECCAGGRQEVL